MASIFSDIMYFIDPFNILGFNDEEENKNDSDTDSKFTPISFWPDDEDD